MGGTNTGMLRHRLRLGSLENPIVVGLDGEERFTESKPRSTHNLILIEDRDATPQNDDAEFRSDSKPKAKPHN
jgi:hypothetical protein